MIGLVTSSVAFSTPNSRESTGESKARSAVIAPEAPIIVNQLDILLPIPLMTLNDRVRSTYGNKSGLFKAATDLAVNTRMCTY